MSIEVRNELFVEDIEKSGLTHRAIAERASVLGDSVSEKSIGRLLKPGHRPSQRVAQAVAKALGKPFTDYVISEALASSAAVPFLGKWTGYFIERDIQGPATVVKEDIELVRSEGRVTGKSFIVTDRDERYDELFNIQIFGAHIRGEVRIPEWPAPAYFQLHLASNAEWAEGLTSWFDYDFNRVEWSRNIWVRKGTPSESHFLRHAQAIIAADVDGYEARYRR